MTWTKTQRTGALPLWATFGAPLLVVPMLVALLALAA